MVAVQDTTTHKKAAKKDKENGMLAAVQDSSDQHWIVAVGSVCASSVSLDAAACAGCGLLAGA